MQRERLSVAGRDLDALMVPAASKDAPVLVFLHEGLGSIDLWRGFPQAIASRTGFGALVYSRYGNGFSEPLRERRAVSYMHDEARVALPELLERLRIDRPFLIGHSDGASIAWIYAATYPQAVRGLVLEAPHVFVEELSVRNIGAIGAAYDTGGLRERMRKHHADADATFRGWNDIWLDPGFRSWSLSELLPAVEAPALVIQGANDEYGTLEQLRTLAARMPASRLDELVLSGCGPSPHRDRGPLVEAAASAWLVEASSR
jgi:pimeloyl-ACP methyl ester carboxylesterase